jgi:hypothetical protein
MLGTEEGVGIFSASADGRMLAYYDSKIIGDVWVIDLGKTTARQP